MPGIVAVSGDISVNKMDKDILVHIAYISEGGDKINIIRKSHGFIIFFSFIFISWRLITLKYCSGFCHTLT